MGICASTPQAAINKVQAIVGLHACDLFGVVLQAAAHCSSVHFPRGTVESGPGASAAAGAQMVDGTVVVAPSLQELSADPALLPKFLAQLSPEFTSAVSEEDAMLSTLLELTGALASMLTKLGGPAQKKYRAATMTILRRLNAVVAAAAKDDASTAPLTSPTVAVVGTAALRWLLPACEYMRWFRPLHEKETEFAELIALGATLGRLAGCPSDASLQEWWLEPSVVPRPGPMSMGPMQHASMRKWMKVMVKAGKSLASELNTAIAAPGAAAGSSVSRAIIQDAARLAARFGWYAKLIETHSVMEDEVIYKEIAKIAPTATVTPTAEHEHEIPIINASAAELQSGAEQLQALLGDGDAISLETEGAADAVAVVIHAIEGEHGIVALESAVEAHFQGEEKHIFPEMQKIAPAKRKTVFVDAFSVCKSHHAMLLPFVIGGLNPAQAEQYMWGLRTHAPLSDDEWRERIAMLKAGVADGKISAESYAALRKRAACVRDFDTAEE